MPKQTKRTGKLKSSDGVLFLAACRVHRLPEPVPEFRLEPTRKWRFDWAWPFFRLNLLYGIAGPDPGVALEIEGGAYTRGRHTRGKGFVADMEKYNRAVILGWRLIRCVPADLKSGKVFEWLKQVLPPLGRA